MSDTAVANEPKEPAEYKVIERAMPWLESKFKRMAKVAAEVGAKPPTFHVIREEFKDHLEPDPFDPGRMVKTGVDKYFVIRVEGESPKIQGWSFVATITHTPQGNLINRVPTEIDDIPVRFRTVDPECAYCGLVRRRTDSMIVRKVGTDEYKQVGRNCLAKFLGFSNPERVASYAAMLANLESELGGEEDDILKDPHYHSDYEDLESFLTMTAAVVRLHGWVSITTSREKETASTVGRVENQLYGRAYLKDYEVIHPTEEDKAKAKEVIAFARSDALTTDSDYKHNLKISLATDQFNKKAMGIVASAIHFQNRTKEQEIEMRLKREQWAKEKAARPVSQYVGNIGDRIVVTVVVNGHRQLDSQFGVTHLYTMTDKLGNIFKWFSSNEVFDLDGSWHDVMGTVKNHETYNEVKQTVLTRCKIVDGGVPNTKSKSARKSSRDTRVETTVGSIG